MGLKIEVTRPDYELKKLSIDEIPIEDPQRTFTTGGDELLEKVRILNRQGINCYELHLFPFRQGGLVALYNMPGYENILKPLSQAPNCPWKLLRTNSNNSIIFLPSSAEFSFGNNLFVVAGINKPISHDTRPTTNQES